MTDKFQFDDDKIVANAHATFRLLAALTQAVVAEAEQNGHITVPLKLCMGNAVAHIMKHVKEDNASAS